MHQTPLRVLTILCLLAVAGCTTAGNVQPPSPAAAAAPPARTVGIAITRSDSLLYFGAPATVEVNGEQVVNLGVGETYKGSIRPGPTVISASAWSSPGRSTYSFNAKAGKVYRFQVYPRSSNLVAGLAAGVWGQVIEGGGSFEVRPLP